MKLLARNGTRVGRDATGAADTAFAPVGIADGVAEVLSWPAARRRVAARGPAQRYPWSATIERMPKLRTRTADGRVDSAIARTEDTR